MRSPFEIQSAECACLPVGRDYGMEKANSKIRDDFLMPWRKLLEI